MICEECGKTYGCFHLGMCFGSKDQTYHELCEDCFQEKKDELEDQDS
jgi:hypothetical protein